ncbi:hypothetical protein ACS0TY_027418 [Phlomoides rotata]
MNHFTGDGDSRALNYTIEQLLLLPPFYNWCTDVETWIRGYENLQRLAHNLIYAQIACALIGSLAPLYNGVLLLHLGISLFALVAIESTNQNLARTYAFLLFCSILLDIFWFFLYSHHIWHIPSDFYGTFADFSVKLMLAMQIIGFSARLLSSLLWIQMYRLGVSHIDNSNARDADVDLRNSFINPATPSIIRLPSGSDDVEGSLYDPGYYSSLLGDVRDGTYQYGFLPSPPQWVFDSSSPSHI